MKAFIDTNVLVYASLSDDPRRTEAEHILVQGGTISVQVLNEFANVARGKLKWSWRDVEAALELIRERVGRVRPLTLDTHAAAVVLARDHRLSFYDALIVASALEAGCDMLLSEDLQHGRFFGGLEVRNPFLPGA